MKDQLQPPDDKIIHLESGLNDGDFTFPHALFAFLPPPGHRVTDRPPTQTLPNLLRSLEVQRNVPGVETRSTQQRRSWGQAR